MTMLFRPKYLMNQLNEAKTDKVYFLKFHVFLFSPKFCNALCMIRACVS